MPPLKPAVHQAGSRLHNKDVLDEQLKFYFRKKLKEINTNTN